MYLRVSLIYDDHRVARKKNIKSLFNFFTNRIYKNLIPPIIVTGIEIKKAAGRKKAQWVGGALFSVVKEKYLVKVPTGWNNFAIR